MLVGNLKLMKEEHIAVSTEHNEGTVVYVSEDGKYAGCIVISDVVKPNTKLALSELKKHGVKKTVMLTGDSKRSRNTPPSVQWNPLCIRFRDILRLPQRLPL